MIFIIKYKNINIIISFILILAIFFNFIIYPKKVYADAGVISGIALKVFISILSSIGILKYVSKNIGVETFYNNFINYYKYKEGLTTLARDLTLAGLNSIYNNTKMKVKSISNYIIKYFNTIRYNKDIEVPSGFQNLYTFSYSTLNRESDYAFYENFPLTEDFFGSVREAYILDKQDFIVDNNKLSIVLGRDSGWQEFHLGILNYSNNKLSNQRFISIDFFKYFSLSEGGSGELSVNISNDFSSVLFAGSFLNFENGKNDNISKTIKLTEFEKSLASGIPLEAAPPISEVDSIPFPWELGLNIDEQIGSTVDSLVDSIADVPTKNWVEELVNSKYGELSKEINKVIVDEETGVITDIKVGDYTDSKPNEGSPILDLELPGEVALDFSPLLDIPVDKKFPFSLPWDIQRSVQVLKSTAKPPKWELPIRGEKIIIDFSIFESLANIIRGFSILIFTLALILISRKMIGS